MKLHGPDGAELAQELFEGDLYRTPALARQSIEEDVTGIHLPYIGFVKRNRAREAAKQAAHDVPREFEEFNHDKLTGATKTAVVYVKRRVANERQPAAGQIRTLLEPATKEGTYRALGVGGWHVTIAKAIMELDGASPEEFAQDVRERFEHRASGLLVPIGNVAILGARVCGNVRGGIGSSRFIGLTPAPESKLLEHMRTTKLLLDPTADTKGDDWFNIPHISVAKAEEKLFGLPHAEQRRLEGGIQAAVAASAENIRPLTLTSLCVEISDASR